MRLAVLEGIQPVIRKAVIGAEAELDLQVCIAVIARTSPRADANPMRQAVWLDMPYLVSECAPHREQTKRQCDGQPHCTRASRRNLPIHKRPPAGDNGQDENDHSKRSPPSRLKAKIHAAPRRRAGMPT